MKVYKQRLTKSTITSDEISFDKEIVEMKNGIVVVPVLGSGEVVLVNQMRHPIGEHRWELHCGYIDTGETSMESAKREVMEECGVLVGSIVHIGTWDVSPGSTTERVHAFLATNCKKVEPGRLKSVLLTEETVIEWILGGKICHATSIAALAMGWMTMVEIENND